MKREVYSPELDIEHLLARPTVRSSEEVERVVAEIFDAVRNSGDAALYRYSEQLDGARLHSLRVSPERMEQASRALPKALRRAVEAAGENIRCFHVAQRREPLVVETTPGIVCERRSVPIERVGLYIPGGSAPLFSTLLMLAIPAELAGCRERVLVSPPDLHPIILAVAHLLEITEVYEVGGAQAIAALALGTESIQPVDKIFGPGNQYVTAAKQLAAHGSGVAIDLPAGPSELLVIADDGATPSAVVADLLSQAEHGPDSQVILLTTSKELFELLPEELERQLQTLPRGEVAAQALAESAAVLVPSTEVAIEISNRYAPEHLIVATRDADDLKSAITAAGSVFLGYFTPESLGDYASGTNHTLPTGGAARGYSGVSLESFQKEITFQRASFEGLQRLAATVECMASAEGLEAHRRAVTVRKEAHE